MLPKSPRASHDFISNVALSCPGGGSALGYRAATWAQEERRTYKRRHPREAERGEPQGSVLCATIHTPMHHEGGQHASEPHAEGIPPGTPILVLDVGCGIRKQPGAIGIDRNPASHPDVLVDLEQFPYPFADNSFDRITAIHVIEHLGDVIRAMEEFHRLLRPGGTLRIETPHYTDYSSFCDPTHKNHLNSFSFRYFGPNHGGFGYYSAARFREISVRVKLLAFWKWLGFEFLVNHFPRYRRFWEHYLCYIVRGKAMEFEFAAEK